MEIGSIIKKARNEAGLTQEQAAEALNVSRQTVSNWENSKSYPDIISVINMSELYSVSLDCLLKEESSLKQSYKDYLKESTDTVKSRDRQAKLWLCLVTLLIWSVSLIAFWTVKDGPRAAGFGMVLLWAVLPVTFFCVSCIVGQRNYLAKLKWGLPLCFGLMYSLSGHIDAAAIEDMIYKTVIWPDFSKFPLGFAISLAGLLAGILLSRSKATE